MSATGGGGATSSCAAIPVDGPDARPASIFSRSIKPPGDIGRQGGQHDADTVALGQKHSPVPAVLQEPVGSPVAGHFDEGDHVDEEARMFSRHHAGIEEIHLGRDLGQHGFHHLAQEIEPRHLGVAEIAQDLRPLGLLDPCRPQRRGQADKRPSRSKSLSPM